MEPPYNPQTGTAAVVVRSIGNKHVLTYQITKLDLENEKVIQKANGFSDLLSKFTPINSYSKE
jgi:hypothetical protein